MGRKPKTVDSSEGVLTPPTPVVEEPVELPNTISSTNNTYYVEDSNYYNTTTITEDTHLVESSKPRVMDEMREVVAEEMAWALGEIQRCNDYIYAKADLDRRFTVYRDELYEYRYKLRQLVFIDTYPVVPNNKIPQRPDVVADV